MAPTTRWIEGSSSDMYWTQTSTTSTFPDSGTTYYTITEDRNFVKVDYNSEPLVDEEVDRDEVSDYMYGIRSGNDIREPMVLTDHQQEDVEYEDLGSIEDDGEDCCYFDRIGL